MTTSRDSKKAHQTIVNPDAKREPQSDLAYLPKVPSAVHKTLIHSYLENQDRASLSRSCFDLYSIYQPDLTKQRLQQLLQAVIDDKREQVKQILDENPRLLLEEPHQTLVIESQYTWQKFYAENALAMAAKRKQIEMMEVLLPYFDKLPPSARVLQTKTDALAKWSFLSDYKEDKGEISIPHEYTLYLQFLIDVFVRENFPNGHYTAAELSEETTAVLNQFRDILLPRNPVRLNDYVDPELFLYAAYKTYEENFDRFLNWHQLDFFCVKIIGFAQSLVTPETAKTICEGLSAVVENKKAISARAASHKLLMGEDFYRPGRDVVSGLGVEYVVGGPGCKHKAGEVSWARTWHRIPLELLYQAKTRSWQTLCDLSLKVLPSNPSVG